MMERLAYLQPEIVLFVATCVVMVLGLSRGAGTRRATPVVAGLGLALAGVIAYLRTPTGADLDPGAGQILLPNLALYGKVLAAGVGLLLLLVVAGTVDRAEEREIALGRRVFDPLRSDRAEFYSFFLFSITGLMLCAGADDLIWLFLALELTSLPTYIMVTISAGSNRARESGVKYFFLGALGAAIFLYGFALIYGATGHTNFNEIFFSFKRDGLSSIAVLGLILSLLGLCFKIAAVPMHFYVADVYEGAAAQVSAFLAFVPKAAGFFAILLLAACVGWDAAGLPAPVRLALWVVAAMTMTVGNVLAILQTSVKRILAYSSVAHSGYMLVGVIAGPGDGSITRSGVGAVLFYLLAYGVTNVGAFAVLAALERSPGPDGEPREIETVDDLRGLCATRPLLGWTMVLCSLSLLGFPPLLGFFAKLPLFTSAIGAGELLLVIVLGLNSAVAAFYYLRLMAMPFLEARSPGQDVPATTPFRSRLVGAGLSAASVVVLVIPAGRLLDASAWGGSYRKSDATAASASPSPVDPPDARRADDVRVREH